MKPKRNRNYNKQEKGWSTQTLWKTRASFALFPKAKYILNVFSFITFLNPIFSDTSRNEDLYISNCPSTFFSVIPAWNDVTRLEVACQTEGTAIFTIDSSSTLGTTNGNLKTCLYEVSVQTEPYSGSSSDNMAHPKSCVKDFARPTELDLRCLSNVKCYGNLCPASPNKVLQEQHFGFVCLLSVKRWSCQPIEAFKTLCSEKNAISNHMIKGYSSALKKQQ